VSAWRLFRSSAGLEAAHLLVNRGFVALTALAAVSFLAMVSLFGLTGGPFDIGEDIIFHSIGMAPD